MNNNIKELDEAKKAVIICRQNIDDIITDLKNTKKWSTFDMFADSFLVSWKKRSNIRKINKKFDQLKDNLNKASDELDDVHLSVNTSLTDTNFDVLFDMIFDNIFTDLRIHGQLNDSINSLKKLDRELEEILKVIDQEKLN